MEDHSVSGSETGDDLGDPVVAMAGLNWRSVRAAVPDDKEGPTVTAPEQSTYRHSQCVVGIPNRHVDSHPVVMPKSRPSFGRVDQVDRDMDPLLLDSKRGNLGKPAGSTRVIRPRIGDPPQPSIRTGEPGLI